MGRIQDWVYALDTGIGAGSQTLNMAAYLASGGRDPGVLIREGHQMANGALQLYQGLRNYGGVDGISDDPELHRPGVVLVNTFNGITSAYDLTRMPERFRQIREANQEDPSRVRRGLRYLSLINGAVSDVLNVAETGSRVARVFGVDV